MVLSTKQLPDVHTPYPNQGNAPMGVSFFQEPSKCWFSSWFPFQSTKRALCTRKPMGRNSRCESDPFLVNLPTHTPNRDAYRPCIGHGCWGMHPVPTHNQTRQGDRYVHVGYAQLGRPRKPGGWDSGASWVQKPPILYLAPSHPVP